MSAIAWIMMAIDLTSRSEKSSKFRFLMAEKTSSFSDWKIIQFLKAQSSFYVNFSINMFI